MAKIIRLDNRKEIFQDKEKEGWAWIDNIQRPICKLYRFKKGKKKGKVRVTLCKGRDTNGRIIKGSTKIIKESSVVELPSEVL